MIPTKRVDKIHAVMITPVNDLMHDDEVVGDHAIDFKLSVDMLVVEAEAEDELAKDLINPDIIETNKSPTAYDKDFYPIKPYFSVRAPVFPPGFKKASLCSM